HTRSRIPTAPFALNPCDPIGDTSAVYLSIAKSIVSPQIRPMKEPWIPGSKTFEMLTLLLPKTALRKLDGERTSSPGQHPLATDKKRAPPICGVIADLAVPSN